MIPASNSQPARRMYLTAACLNAHLRKVFVHDGNFFHKKPYGGNLHLRAKIGVLYGDRVSKALQLRAQRNAANQLNDWKIRARTELRCRLYVQQRTGKSANKNKERSQ